MPTDETVWSCCNIWSIKVKHFSCNAYLVLLVLQEIRLNFEDLLEVEGTHVQNEIQINFAVLHVVNRSHSVDGLDALLQMGEFISADQVGLISENTISEGKLFDCFVLNTFGLGVVQMCQQKLAIHNGDDTVKVVVTTNVVVDKEAKSS
jgi:hypothetical protein